MAETRVTALLERLVTGKSYGFARILDGDAAGATALCGSEVSHSKVPIGQPFQCLVTLGPRGWLVTSLVCERAEGIYARIRDRPERNPFLRVTPASAAAFTTAILYDQVLWEVGLSDLYAGTPLIVDVDPETTGWAVTRVVSPTSNDVFVGAGVVEVIAIAIRSWPEETSSAGKRVSQVRLRCWDPISMLAIDVFMNPRLLRQAGLSGLTAAEDLSQKGAKIAETAIDTVEQALQSADYEGAKLIRPSHLKVEIVREEGKTYPRWQVAKLLAPRSSRPPASDHELVDWVEGIIVQEVSASRDGIVAFTDPRVGQGEAFLKKFHIESTPQDFVTGNKVIVGLKAYADRWSIAQVHAIDRGDLTRRKTS